MRDGVKSENTDNNMEINEDNERPTEVLNCEGEKVSFTTLVPVNMSPLNRERSTPMILMPRDQEQTATGSMDNQPIFMMPLDGSGSFGSQRDIRSSFDYGSPEGCGGYSSSGGSLSSPGGSGGFNQSSPGGSGGFNQLSPYNSPTHNIQTVTQVSPPPPLSGICHIQIFEEPEEKFRFRYKSEMQGTHGCIHGKSYTKKSKKFPTIQVHNVPADVSKIRVRVALYTNERPRNHHVHKVMWKAASETEEDFVVCDITRSQGFKHTWQGLGIIHTSRKYIDETLFNRIKKVFLEQKGARRQDNNPSLTDAEELKLKNDAHKMGKSVTDKLNTVVLGFEAFKVDNGIYTPICSMAFTNPINNLKNPSTGELKICRISTVAGSVEGGEEIFIFIERVMKGNIQVRFFELDQDDERGWTEFAEFGEGDVHHQYAIAFKTPRYHNTNVETDVGVFFELYRPSDGAVSDPKAFKYKPMETVRLGKRARLEVTARRSKVEPVVENFGDNNTLNLNSIIENLLKDNEYMDQLSEPSPYDHITNIGSRDIVPDLLVFNRPHIMELTPGGCIASDSVSQTDSRTDSQTDMLDSMTKTMMNLTTNSAEEVAREHVRNTMVDVTDSLGNNLLHMAVLSENGESLRQILNIIDKLDLPGVLDLPNRSGSTALILAVSEHKLPAVKLLLAAGAGVNCQDRDGDSPVHLAVKEGDCQMLKVLLEFMADPNIPNNYGKFPVHLAVENNMIDMLRILVDHGLDVDAREQVSGRTALHIAVERQMEDMVTTLVKEAKVEVMREDYKGQTALPMAEDRSNKIIAKIVRKAANKQIG